MKLMPISTASHTRRTASSSVLPAGSPSRLKPPQPSPATLTFNPVFPKVVYSIAYRSSEFATTSCDQLLSHDELQVALGSPRANLHGSECCDAHSVSARGQK